MGQSGESTLDEAIRLAIGKKDPIQVKMYLDAVNVPLSVLRQVRRRHKIVRDAYGEYIRRAYQLLSLYLKALDMPYLVRKSVWHETKKIVEEMDYHTMELYTWLVQQMYTFIENKKDGENLHEMRGQFGGFYDFASGWLKDGESENEEDTNKMRLVLHKGLTKWLIAAIDNNDTELIEQLCEASRKIVFGRDEINFEHKEAVMQQFVLFGHLVGRVKTNGINASAVEKLFCDRHEDEPKVGFNSLVEFSRAISLPFKTLNPYLDVFWSPKEVQRNLLTGSSSSSGFGMMGDHETSLAFIYLAAHAITEFAQMPEPVAEMSGRIRKEDIKTVEEVFPSLNYGSNKLNGWIDNCEKSDQAEDAKKISEADIDPTKVKEYIDKFWEGYSRAVPVLTICLKNGNYEIDDNARKAIRYILPKIALFNWKYPIIGAEGDRYGFHAGRTMEKNLLRAIVKGIKARPEVKDDMSKAIEGAVEWLEKEGCNNDNGLILVVSKKLLEIEMNKNNDFIPSWREEVKSRGFKGFYRGFPISQLREGDEQEAGENETKEKKSNCQRVVAVDLRGWLGLRVREEVVEKRIFGELDIRTWTAEEIQQAIKSGKLKAEDENKAKGNCPVDATFYWEFDENKLPRTRVFTFEN